MTIQVESISEDACNTVTETTLTRSFRSPSLCARLPAQQNTSTSASSPIGIKHLSRYKRILHKINIRLRYLLHSTDFVQQRALFGGLQQRPHLWPRKPPQQPRIDRTKRHQINSNRRQIHRHPFRQAFKRSSQTGQDPQPGNRFPARRGAAEGNTRLGARIHILGGNLSDDEPALVTDDHGSPLLVAGFIVGQFRYGRGIAGRKNDVVYLRLVTVGSVLEGRSEVRFERVGLRKVTDMPVDLVCGGGFGVGFLEGGQGGGETRCVRTGDDHRGAGFDRGFGDGVADAGGAAEEEDAGVEKLGVFLGRHFRLSVGL